VAPGKGAAPGDAGPAVELLLNRQERVGGARPRGPAIDSGNPSPTNLAEARCLGPAPCATLADAGVQRGEMVVLLRAFTHLDGLRGNSLRPVPACAPYVVGGRGYWVPAAGLRRLRPASPCLAQPAPTTRAAAGRPRLAGLRGPSRTTLWAAAGRERRGGAAHLWPTLAQIAGDARRGPSSNSPARLEQIPAAGGWSCCAASRRRSRGCGRGGNAAAAGRADSTAPSPQAPATTLAVLLKPAGEARFRQTFRKLMQLAAEFEARERAATLRGPARLPSAFREAAADEGRRGHRRRGPTTGLRIMERATGAKGAWSSAVVRRAPTWTAACWAGRPGPPLLTFGHGEDRRVGNAAAPASAARSNQPLLPQPSWREDANDRDAEEGLRLFHVARHRAPSDRLILSGVVKEKPGEERASTPVIERIPRRLRDRARRRPPRWAGSGAPSRAPVSSRAIRALRDRGGAANLPLHRPGPGGLGRQAGRRRRSRPTRGEGPRRRC